MLLPHDISEYDAQPKAQSIPPVVATKPAVVAPTKAKGPPIGFIFFAGASAHFCFVAQKASTTSAAGHSAGAAGQVDKRVARQGREAAAAFEGFPYSGAVDSRADRKAAWHEHKTTDQARSIYCQRVSQWV